MRKVCLFLMVSLCCLLGAFCDAAQTQTKIVVGSQDAAVVCFGAKDLAGYVSKITGKPAEVVKATAEFKFDAGTDYFVIGNLETNVLIKKLYEQGNAAAIDSLPAKEDAFVITSFETGVNEPRGVIIAGRDGKGILYGIYHYLEEIAGCGFFRDGDYVPTLSKMPTDGIFVSQQPRFPRRLVHFFGGVSYRSLDKFDSSMWGPDKWKSEFEWMAKRKLNLLTFAMSWNAASAGDVPYKVFPEIGKPKEEPLYHGGFVSGWCWPPSYRTAMMKDILGHARFLGHKVYYGTPWGIVPDAYRKAHPELKTIGTSQYGICFLDPLSPATTEVMYKYMKALDDTFGTDNMYFDTPFCEWAVSSDFKETIKLKIKAATEFQKTTKRLSSDAIWVTDSWDFNADYWKDEAVKYYLENLPADTDMIMYDTSADYRVPAHYETTNNFYGRDWTFGVLNSFGGDDGLHGNIDHLFARLKNVTKGPRAKNLVGIFQVPELVNDNILLYNLVYQLAWDPDKFSSVSQYLNWYTEHRYGSKHFATMRPVVEQLYQAVYRIPAAKSQSDAMMRKAEGDEGLIEGKSKEMYQYCFNNSPFYQFPYIGFGGIWAGTDEWSNSEGLNMRLRDEPIFKQEVPSLEKAIKMALKAKEQCPELAENKLFENDLVDMARTYLGLRFNLEMLEAYDAFKAGDKGKFEQKAAKSLETMTGVEKILSTRPDFSLQRMIDEVMEVPGTNKYAPEMIKQGNISGGCYTNKDCYEMTKLYSRPRIEEYYNLLRAKMKKGNSTITFGEFRKMLKDNFWQDGQWEYGKNLVSANEAKSGKKSLHLKAFSAVRASVKNSPADIKASLWIKPIERKDIGKLVFQIEFFNASGTRVANMAYVLMGKENYWEHHNKIVDGISCFVKIIDMPMGKWQKFTTKSAKKDFEEQFGVGTWKKLGIHKIEFVMVAWRPNDKPLAEAYIDDVDITITDNSGEERRLYCDFEKPIDPLRLNKFLHQDLRLPADNAFKGTPIEAIDYYINR